MGKPCTNCIYDGDNSIRCKDCEREGGIYYHYVPQELETITIEPQQKPVESQKKRKRGKK